jgi:hypothetical protein
MSLVKLLASGKSLIGVEETESRYRLAGQKWLPEFAAVKNPFASTVTPKCNSPACHSPEGAGANTTAQEVAKQSTHQQLAVKQATEACPAAKRFSGAKFAGKLLAAFNPFSPRLGGKLRPAGGARLAAPVQGELSLDNVKVVRNDLSDSDLPIVPLRSSAVDMPEVPATAATEDGSGKVGTFGRLTSRLFGAEGARVL